MTTLLNPIELAQRLIRIPSVSPDSGECLRFLQASLESVGFLCAYKVFSQGGNYPTPNLYAKIGQGVPNFCFAGHTDVVPPGDLAAWKVDPYGGVIEGDTLYGRGAADMKGAIAAFACAAQRFASRHVFTGSISLLITGDEEAEAINGTQEALKWIASLGETLDACLVGEASCEEKLGDTVKVGRRGSLGGALTVMGKQGHVAYPHLANNPLPILTKIINDLYKQKLDEGDAYFPPSNFEATSIDTGNLASNVIPGQAKANFNIRFNPYQTPEKLMEWIEQVCQRHTQDYSLTWKDKGLPFYTAEGSFRALVAQAVHKITGIEPLFSTGGGTSDGRYIHKYCPVVEFGVVNKTIHQINEAVPTEDLIKLKDIYYAILCLYFDVKD